MILEKVLGLKIAFIQNFGYLILFLATFLESLPIAGLFIPGSLIIFIAGFFAKLPFMNGPPIIDIGVVMIVAISGSILGDLFGYLIGRYSGKKFLHRYCKYLLIKREYIEKAGDLVCGHTGKSLIIGRLNPLTRCVAPFIVGAHKVNFLKFMMFNIIGGVLYGFLFSSLGYFFGHSYHFAQSFEKIILIITILIVIVIYLGFYIRSIIEKNKIQKNFKEGKIGDCIGKWA